MTTYTVNAITNTTYRNCKNITSVDLQNIPWVNDSMANAFQNCYNLTSVSNINENVINMCYTFSGCNLVNAPIIPNSVINMSGTFYECVNLVNAPEIPNSVTNMKETFQGCYNLMNAPSIPNSVTDMSWTFESCDNIITAPNIPESVVNMGWTFYSCGNMSGDVYIYSNNISDASDCFYVPNGGTGFVYPERNVYIPFNYENGVYTTTYETFTEWEGYSPTERKYGVLLMDINEEIEWIQPTMSDAGTWGVSDFAVGCAGTTYGAPWYPINHGSWSGTPRTGTASSWWGFYSKEKIRITKLHVAFTVSRIPVLQASNDGVNWVNLVYTASGSATSYDYILTDNTEYYSYYRLYWASVTYPGIDDVTITAYKKIV